MPEDIAQVRALAGMGEFRESGGNQKSTGIYASGLLVITYVCMKMPGPLHPQTHVTQNDTSD